MTNAICADTNQDDKITEKDHNELYLLDLSTETMECLTCGLGLDSVNNPDYSKINEKIVFSARKGPDFSFPHHIFTIDSNKNLKQITFDKNYYSFDCAWSEDASKIVFGRMEPPMLTSPSHIWLMDADGANKKEITGGGMDKNNEGKFGFYPIGVDVDPDLSPDNKKIAFNRLRTGEENKPFGIWEFVIVDVDTKEEELVDAQFTNGIPEWKEGGILFMRQIGGDNPAKWHHNLYIYKDGKYKKLEKEPYNHFPFGGWGGSWINL